MILLRYILLYFIILLGSIFIADKLKDKVQNTIAVYLMSSICCLYIFGLLNLLNFGILLTSMCSAILGMITILKYIKDKNVKQLRKIICTPGMIFFTLIFLIFIITTLKRTITHWDQYSYWSYAAKDMYYSGKINIQNSIGIQYPPMPAILQVYFMKIIGMYSQGIEIFTTWILGFSLLIPLFNKTNNKKITNFAIGIIIICIPAIFSMLIFYESAYPDALLGLLIGYILKVYFFESNEKIKNITLPLAMLVVTIMKPTGFVIAGIMTITFFIYEIIKNKIKFTQLIKNKTIKKIIIYTMIIVLTYISYNTFFKIFNNSIEQQNSKESNISYIISNIFTTTLGTPQDDYSAAESNGNLLDKLQNTTEIYTPVYISALGVICVYIIVSIFIYKYSNNNENISKKDVKYIYISIFIGLAIYILFLQIAYITKFSTKEMINHDGFERYIGTYLLGILYLTTNIVLEKIKNKHLENNLPYVILAAVIFTITPMHSIANATITSGIYNIDNQSYLSKSYESAEYIKQRVDENNNVLGICQKSELRLENLIIRYYMYPINYKIMDKIDQSKGTFDEIIKNYNYIYIVYSDSYL